MLVYYTSAIHCYRCYLMEVGKVTSLSFWWSSENVPQTVWEKKREHTAEMPRHPPWLKTVQLIGVLLLSSWHLCATSLSQPFGKLGSTVQMLHSWNLPAKKVSLPFLGCIPDLATAHDCPQDLNWDKAWQPVRVARTEVLVGTCKVQSSGCLDRWVFPGFPSVTLLRFSDNLDCEHPKAYLLVIKDDNGNKMPHFERNFPWRPPFRGDFPASHIWLP
jgi:hypothetical protein